MDKDYFPPALKMPVTTNCILATQDEIIDYNTSLDFVSQLKKINENGQQINSIEMISGHFFHGLITEITSLVISLLLPHMPKEIVSE